MVDLQHQPTPASQNGPGGRDSREAQYNMFHCGRGARRTTEARATCNRLAVKMGIAVTTGRGGQSARHALKRRRNLGAVGWGTREHQSRFVPRGRGRALQEEGPRSLVLSFRRASLVGDLRRLRRCGARGVQRYRCRFTPLGALSYARACAVPTGHISEAPAAATQGARANARSVRRKRAGQQLCGVGMR